MLALKYFDCATVVKVQYFEVKVVSYMCPVWDIFKVLDCIKYQVLSFDALKLILRSNPNLKKMFLYKKVPKPGARVIAQHQC